MNRRLAAFTVLAALALGFLLVRTDTAEATSAHKKSFTSAYPDAANTRLDSCSTCHTSAPDLNFYGADLKAAGISFSAIALKDSDGDGVNNQDEIRALTFPGNASDKSVTTSTRLPRQLQRLRPAQRCRPRLQRRRPAHRCRPRLQRLRLPRSPQRRRP